MSGHVYMVRSTLESPHEWVQRCDDIALTFTGQPSTAEVAEELERMLLELEPGCDRVTDLRFTRIA